MCANSKRLVVMTRLNSLVMMMFLALLPCTLVYSQTPTPDQPTKNLEANEQEKKEWRDLLDRFNGLVKEADWAKAEQLANETANKYGHQDALVQHMLLTSINGKRKSQGLAPILIEKIQSAANSESPSIVMAYPLKDYLPTDEIERGKYVKVLIECLSASMPDSDASGEAKIAYHQNQSLIVIGTQRQQKLVADILNRLKQKSNP